MTRPIDELDGASQDTSRDIAEQAPYVGALERRALGTTSLRQQTRGAPIASRLIAG